MNEMVKKAYHLYFRWEISDHHKDWAQTCYIALVQLLTNHRNKPTDLQPVSSSEGLAIPNSNEEDFDVSHIFHQ